MTPPSLLAGDEDLASEPKRETGHERLRRSGYLLLSIAMLVLAGIFAVGDAGRIATAVCGFAACLFFLAGMTDGSLPERMRISRAFLLARARCAEARQSAFLELAEAAGDIYLHRDARGRILWANRNFCQLFSLPNCDMLRGRTLDELGFNGSSANREEGELTLLIDGHTRWFRLTRQRNEATGGSQAIGRDITEHRKAQQALIDARTKADAANAAKGRFLATVSHEIRTPMNGISGMAKLMADTPLTEEQRTYLGAIDKSADALMVLIEDLLDFSKIEAGKLTIERGPADIRELTESVCELLASRHAQKNIVINARTAKNVPDTVDIDYGKLRQVVLNLVGNAVKFTEKGGVTVDVSLSPGKGAGNLRIDVSDTGPGLSQADQARIFGEFEQADSSETRRHGGAGLGLAISRRIVEAMDGWISVESRQGTGSVFTIEIPVPELPLEERRGRFDGDAFVLLAAKVEGAILERMLKDEGGVVHRATDRADAARKLLELGGVLFMGASHHVKAQDALSAWLNENGSRAIVLIDAADRGRLPSLRRDGFHHYLARPVRGRTLVRIADSALRPTPMPAQTDTARPQKASSSAVVVEEGRQRRILVAEDNPVNALLVRAALTKAGHMAEVVGTGRQAVEAIQCDEPYDLVLLDLHMPEMGGMEALNLIRRMEESNQARPIPIHVLTADTQQETLTNAMQHGANGVLHKPIDPTELISLVERTDE